MATVREVIAKLLTFDQDIPVCHKMYSEYLLLDLDELRVVELCEERDDGWVARKRPDKLFIKYLVLPGN